MSGLRIWVDALGLDQQAAGIGQYIRSLFEAYGQKFPEDTISGFFQPGITIAGVNSAHVVETSSSRARIWYEQWKIPELVRSGPYDVIHFPDYQLPLLRRLPRAVMTVHDLAAFVLPEVFPGSKTRAKRFFMRHSVTRAGGIIVPSNATKTDLVKILGVRPEIVHVVHHGVRERGPAPPGRVHPNPYLLAVGTIEPRKNFARLIQAYHLLRQRRQQLPDLVIAGKRGWMYDETLELPEKLGVAQSVKFLQYVAEDTLAALYRDAEGFVYPSLYEGFGLPVIEAMQAGIPVVTSSEGALAELGADSLWRVDPYDLESIAEQIGRVVDGGEDVVARARLAQKWTRQFTWENTAVKTREVYEKAALGG